MSIPRPARPLLLARKLAVGLWLSRHTTRPPWTLPIVGNLRSRVIVERGAVLDVRGRVRLGDAPIYVGYVARGMAPVIELKEGATLRFRGDAVLGDGTKILLGPGASVDIGHGTGFDGDLRVISVSSISIGSGCTVAWDVLIMDTDFHQIDGRNSDLPVVIGDRVWIGAGAKILKGVTIGDGAVIGADSVVTSDVKAGTIVAGNPARVLREDVSWK